MDPRDKKYSPEVLNPYEVRYRISGLESRHPSDSLLYIFAVGNNFVDKRW